jgi:hypothetical protein
MQQHFNYSLLKLEAVKCIATADCFALVVLHFHFKVIKLKIQIFVEKCLAQQIKSQQRGKGVCYGI